MNDDAATHLPSAGVQSAQRAFDLLETIVAGGV